MPRNMARPKRARPISELQLRQVNDTEKIENTDAELQPDETEEAVSFAGFRYVLHDRLRPRHFSTLGNKILIESPEDSVLIGDRLGFLNHRNWIHMITDFIRWSQQKHKEHDDAIMELRNLMTGGSNEQ